MNFWQLVLSTFVLLLQTAPVWAIPICTANVINLITQAVGEGAVSAEIWKKIGINAAVLTVLIAQNVPTTVWRWKITSKMLRKTSAGIKSSVIRKLQSLSITYHKDVQTGKIQSKFLKDTDSVDQLFHCLMFSIIPNVINVIVSAVIAIRGNLWVSLFFLLIIPCNVSLTVFFRKRVRARHRDYRIKTEGMSARLSTMLEMLPVTKAHGLEQQEIETVTASIAKLSASGRQMDSTSSYFGSGAYVVNNLLSIGCLFFCAFLALRGIIQVGDIVLYQSMFSSLSGAVSGLIGMLPMLAGGFEALSSVGEIMNATEVEQTEGKEIINSITGAVRFEDVSYRYPDGEEDVVRRFTLDVKAGECIAVVGSSGSGKSTLMNLIIGLLLPTEGKILVDDHSLADCNLSSYRQHISVVPQSSVLFSGSIRDNITYGGDYTEEELQRVVEMANLKEMLAEMPLGLDSEVGEHGDKLSGGQKQRVTIARALIRNPKILILDEATSALDNVSEYHVQQAISQSIRGRTTFIVAHRLSTIRDADRIVVLENGEIVEMGTYDELMEKQGRFFLLKQLNEKNIQTATEGLQ